MHLLELPVEVISLVYSHVGLEVLENAAGDTLFRYRNGDFQSLRITCKVSMKELYPSPLFLWNEWIISFRIIIHYTEKVRKSITKLLAMLR